MFGGKKTGVLAKLHGWLAGAAAALAETPADCAFCRKALRVVRKPLMLCPHCEERIPWIVDVRCPICGRPDPCPDCPRRSGRAFVMSRSAVRYDAAMKEWLAAFKYRGDERLQELLAAMLVHAFHQLTAAAGLQRTTIDLLTFVPISAERMAERGFNQGRLLAERLGHKLRLPVVPLLVRERATAKQSMQIRAERLSNLRGAFAPDPRGMAWLRSRQARLQRPLTVIIVDDVYTTGTTLHECSRTIGSELEANIYGLTWAR